jgi:hypothetical protein
MLSSNPKPSRKGTTRDQQAQQPQLSYVQRVPVGGNRNTGQSAVHYQNSADYMSRFDALNINTPPAKPLSAPLPYRQKSAYIKQPVNQQDKYSPIHQQDKYLASHANKSTIYNQQDKYQAINQEKYLPSQPNQANQHYSQTQVNTPIYPARAPSSSSSTGSTRQQTPHPPFSPESMSRNLIIV